MGTCVAAHLACWAALGVKVGCMRQVVQQTGQWRADRTMKRRRTLHDAQRLTLQSSAQIPQQPHRPELQAQELVRAQSW